MTQKLLQIKKRERTNLETVVDFLMNRVSKIDVDDWKKLGRVLTWILNTTDEKIL